VMGDESFTPVDRGDGAGVNTSESGQCPAALDGDPEALAGEPCAEPWDADPDGEDAELGDDDDGGDQVDQVDQVDPDAGPGAP